MFYGGGAEEIFLSIAKKFSKTKSFKIKDDERLINYYGHYFTSIKRIISFNSRIAFFGMGSKIKCVRYILT